MTESKNIRKENFGEDLKFVKEHVGQIQITSPQQHLLGEIQEMMESYPSTIGRPIVEEALARGGTISISLIVLKVKEIKPILTKGWTIVVNE